MSILTAAWHKLQAGNDPFVVFRDTKAQVDAWATGAMKNLPADVKPMIDQLASEVKQGASNLAASVGDALPGLLAAPTAAVDDAFAAAATAYLGPTLGRVLSKAEVDGLNRLEDIFINQIKSAKLTHLAAVTGASAPPSQGS